MIRLLILFIMYTFYSKYCSLLLSFFLRYSDRTGKQYSNSKCWDCIIIYNHACFGMIGERVVGSDSEYTVYSCLCLPLFFPFPRYCALYSAVQHNLSSKIRDCTELSLSC